VIRLGLRANWRQFALLVVINAFVWITHLCALLPNSPLFPFQRSRDEDP
jgi:hypothetical protein